MISVSTDIFFRTFIIIFIDTEMRSAQSPISKRRTEPEPTKMTNFTILSGRFARVFTGNMTTGWLPEGDDLQSRANANIDPYWTTGGRDCPVYERDVEAHAVMSETSVVSVFTSRKAAEAAIARAMAAIAA